MKNKYQLRIPTIQYGYIEAMFEGTKEEALEEYETLLKIFNGGEGVSDKEYKDALDEYLSKGTGNTELFLRMDKSQQKTLQDIKNSLKRINK